jgi:signal transduction histidine kinase
MALEMAETSLRETKDEAASRAITQIKWAFSVSEEALAQLDVLHVQAGRIDLNPGCYSWKKLLEEALQRLTPRLNSVKLYSNNKDVLIWGDSEYLITVLENLLQNALDALAKTKNEDFTPALQVEIGQEFEWGFIRIIDNGPGISRKELRKIFRPFYTTKSTKNNWGMGLAYCHRVIKAHRGFINVRSVLGEGTTVEVLIRNVNR